MILFTLNYRNTAAKGKVEMVVVVSKRTVLPLVRSAQTMNVLMLVHNNI